MTHHAKGASNRRADLRATGDLPIVKRRDRYCNALGHPPVEGDNVRLKSKGGKLYQECRACHRDEANRNRFRGGIR